jgi:hypothetical protein
MVPEFDSARISQWDERGPKTSRLLFRGGYYRLAEDDMNLDSYEL